MAYFFKTIIFTLLVSVAFLEADNNNTLNNPFQPATTVERNVATQTNDTNTSNWNIADFKNHFTNNGMNDGMAGNTNTVMMQGTQGGLASTQDPNKLTNDSLKINPETNATSWMQGWDTTISNTIKSNALNNINVALPFAGKNEIDCFITRDISFQYQCTKNNMVYGGDMNSNGKMAKLKCEHDCFSQETCVSVQDTFNATNVIKQTSATWIGSVSKDANLTITIPIFEKRIMNKMAIDMPAQYSGINLSVEYTKNDNTKQSALSKINLQTYDNNASIPIDAVVKSIKLTYQVNNKDINATNVKINAISFSYVSDRKFICPILQDVKNLDQSTLGNKCLYGQLTTFTMSNGKEYELCSTTASKGNNPDGTFSDEGSCSAICKMSYACKPNYTTMNTATLEQLREGCMQGSDNIGCSDISEDCKISRVTKAPILNETVFNASTQSRNTITDGAQIQGTDRPRIEANDILSYERKKQEEWKDVAFKDMSLNSKYNKTDSVIGGISPAQNAYRIQLGMGVDVGLSGSTNVATRGLMWTLKPKSTDANNGINKFFYAIIKTRLGYMDYDVNGEKQKKFKDIWYLKTSLNTDDLLPIKYGKDIGYIGSIDGNITFVYNQYASLEDKTFNTSSKTWVAFNPNQTAQHFTDNLLNASDNNGKPFWEFPVVNNSGLIVKQFGGMTIHRDPLPTRTEYFDGVMDGTGDGMLYYEVFVYYTSTQQTFSQLYTLMNSGEMPSIYKSAEPYMYSKTLAGDGVQSNKNIKIFKYGPPTKTSVFTQMYPNTQDIGKKGFIYVFIQ